MALNPGKYKPSVCSIDEIDDKHAKMLHCENDLSKQQQQQHHHHQQQQQQQRQRQTNQHLEGSETAPLTTNQQKLNIDDNMATHKDLESQLSADGATTVADLPNAEHNGSLNGFRGFRFPERLSFDALMRLSRKRRILYISTACLCALLLVIIIMMIAFWPDVPFYLRAQLCLDKECLVASQQILLWSNSSSSACHETYDWACGKFQREYEENDYFVIKRGEWDYQTFNEYQELNELNRFISMLPSTGVSYSVESMISSLYRSCREIDILDKSQSDLLLKKAIKSVDGWQAFRDTNRLQYWEYKKALVHLQAIYGIFPYYKVSIENRYNKPHDYIITLSEGEIGLPDTYFYNIDENDEIIRGYKLLLRDFAINMGIVAREAELFSDEILHYEKRIVNHIKSAIVKSTRVEGGVNEIRTLAELKNIAPSLPIFETLQALFPHTKINEETEVLVRDVELSELSTVVSTSDKKPINNFIVWSLARHLLPHLSREYRTLVENFDHAIYGRTAAYPRWTICTKIVREWLPFAVDALQQKPHLIRTSQLSDKSIKAQFPNKTYGNDQFLHLMYLSLSTQLQDTLERAEWIEEPLKNFIIDKLTSMRLQIGIPEEALQSKDYIQDYYNELLLNNLFFVEHLESIWSFRKARMEEKLKALNIVDTIISEMYTQAQPQPIFYSNILNMLIISRSIAGTKYYDYRYPVAVNFARIGADIAEALINTISIFTEQFRAENYLLNSSEYSNFLEQFNLAQLHDAPCIGAGGVKEDVGGGGEELSGANALKSFHTTLSAAQITAKSLSSFIRAIDTSSPVTGVAIDKNLSYESLHLTQRHRLPGLRSYSENELFTLAYMQKHCSSSIADKDYARIKPHVEKKLAERYLFNATWNYIRFLPRSSSCSIPKPKCPDIL